MQYSNEVEEMVCVKRAQPWSRAHPRRGQMGSGKGNQDISGFTHGVGWCAPQQGACKLTLNVKDGVIEEALVETIGCSGMTHSAAMASEILPGKTILEALNTDLVCDAINTAMRELFLQIVYGRTQSAFSEDGLPVGAGLEDLGKGLRSQVGTMFATKAKGARYLEMAEGYVTQAGARRGRRGHRLRVRQPGQDDGRHQEGHRSRTRPTRRTWAPTAASTRRRRSTSTRVRNK